MPFFPLSDRIPKNIARNNEMDGAPSNMRKNDSAVLPGHDKPPLSGHGGRIKEVVDSKVEKPYLSAS